MNLYDRSIDRAQVRSDAGIFVRKTYAYFAASLLVAAIGSIVGLHFIKPLLEHNIAAFIIMLVVEIALCVYVMRAEHESNLAILALFAFAFVSGLSLCGIIAYTLASQGGMVILAQALFLTTLAFAALSVYAFVTKKDYSVYAGAAFVVLWVIIGASLINIFWPNQILYNIISGVSAILFSFYIIYDTQNLIRGEYKTPIQGAICLYVDFINLFVSLLRILNSLQRN